MGTTTAVVGRDEERCRVDLHCHSSASEESRLGVQRAVGLPECATPPEEVYALAKRRGMDFVTITDHDTIDGVLQIADRPDVFVSEELTAHFRDEPQAVHVLCFGIDGEVHEWLQAHSGDVELCAEYLRENRIACALAHPYYTVGAALLPRHRRRLAELFEVWEVRNGARAAQLNQPAATYVATCEGIGTGGSDDHAGVDIGRTFTESPPASDPGEFLQHLRDGNVIARGAQGSAAKWAHAAIALAVRSLGFSSQKEAAARVDPSRVMGMVARLLREADARHGPIGSELSPEDARCLLDAWRGAVGLQSLDEAALLELMQAEDFSHAALFRRASRAHERKLREAVGDLVASVTDGPTPEDPTLAMGAAQGVFESCIAVIPYAPAAAFLAREQAKLAEIALPAGAGPGRRERESIDGARVAILADGIGSTHGVTRTIEEIRQRGVPGFEIEVVGTDSAVDRRLPAVAEIEVPFYPGLAIGVPSLASAVQSLADGCFRAIHVSSPGPVGIVGALVARAMGLPLVGSYHTELASYAEIRARSRVVGSAVQVAVGAFYGACDVVLSPSEAADDALAALGVLPERVMRWDRGVDTQRFTPAQRPCTPGESQLGDGSLTVLYAGRITHEKGVELLADAFLMAREQCPRLHLVLAGDGPERGQLAERLGDSASFLGWLEGAQLPAAYASADMFVFPSATDTFGQVVLEAQASGVPVVAVDAGGPRSLIEDRVSGILCPPRAAGDERGAAGPRPLATVAGASRRGGDDGGAGAHMGWRAPAPGRRLPGGAGTGRHGAALAGRVSGAPQQELFSATIPADGAANPGRLGWWRAPPTTRGSL
jgi:glycosyltransferase involved in cell wall biosynthesis/predicted metal-dependent phosphoesterase TrpH